jgi:hypothetical protein
LLALGLRSKSDILALKELEAWFDTKEEAQSREKLDPVFKKLDKLATRRLKREIKRRASVEEGTLAPGSRIP